MMDKERCWTRVPEPWIYIDKSARRVTNLTGNFVGLT
jgi:hypothetical protein